MNRSAEFMVRTLRHGGSVRATVAGLSMWPTFSPGDRVDVDPLAEGAVPRPGDIVALLSATGIVVHRLIRASAGRLVTWGDNTMAGDVPCGVDEVIGLVRPVSRSRRWIPWPR